MHHVRIKPRFLPAGLVLAAALFISAAAAVLVEPFVVNYDSQTRNTVVFMSDTQAPSFFEALWLMKYNNEEATLKILDQASREKNLAAAFILGDVTRAASTDSNWQVVDGFLVRLKQEGVPAFAAIGNHDYLWTSRNGERNFRKRFPQLTTLWYSVVIGPAAVIVLDSNFNELTPGRQKEQMVFYQAALAQYGDDPAIRGILVCCHHAPFTNGMVVGPTAKVESDFVPVFVKARKGLLFLSGHSHTAEHFVIEGKDFLVLGGGGGLLHPRLAGSARLYKDVFPVLDQPRIFHYVTVEIKDEGLVVTYQMLLMDLSKFEPVHTFTVKW